jgi:hypothetical protein
MKKVSTPLLLILLLAMNSCKNSSSSNTSSSSEESSTSADNDEKEIDGYEDGDYCAEVTYYYDKTGTTSTYTLKVEIEDNDLVKLYWPNGGCLDNSHFSPPDISDGDANFESEQGIEYTVRIIGKDNDCLYSLSAEDEDDLIEEADEITCPKCGEEKDTWENLCRSCTDAQDNTCSKCGDFEYYVFGGLCHTCKKEIAEEREKENEENEE